MTEKKLLEWLYADLDDIIDMTGGNKDYDKCSEDKTKNQQYDNKRTC